MAADAKARSDQDTEADRYILPNAFNIQLLKRWLLKQDAVVMMAPRAGIGIEISMTDALFALCLVEANREEVPNWVFQRLLESGQQMVFGEGSESEAIAVAVEKFRETRLPKFLELGILEPVE